MREVLSAAGLASASRVTLHVRPPCLPARLPADSALLLSRRVRTSSPPDLHSPARPARRTLRLSVFLSVCLSVCASVCLTVASLCERIAALCAATILS